MRVHVVAVSQKLPAWIKAGIEAYAHRLPKEYPYIFTSLPLSKRVKSSVIERLKIEEGKKIRASLPKKTKTIALDVKGKGWSTEMLAKKISLWQQETAQVNFLIGGPDGLSPEILQFADECWSLSPLTFPHAMVHLILIEQIYRAICILKDHPYHRAS